MTTETTYIEGPLAIVGALTGATNVPTYRADVFANRGAASAHASEFFFATDDPIPSSGTLYQSDGTNWTLIASPRGELGRTTLTSNSSATSGTAFTDITSFTLQLVLATARAIQLNLYGPVQNTAADTIDAQILVVESALTGAANAVIGRQTIPAAAITANVDHRIGLTVPANPAAATIPAGTWNFKVQMRAPNSGTAKFTSAVIGANGGFLYAYLQAVLL